MGLKLENKKDEVIKLHLEGKTITEISKIFNCYTQNVTNVLKSTGQNIELNKKKSHSFNSNYFTSIDTEAKAYFLGFIAADGALVHCHSGLFQLTISINKKDIYILEELKREMDMTHSIQNLAKNQVRLAVMNKQLTADLIRYGITPRKSLTMQPMLHHIPNDLKHHFIRGYFDGDGSIFQTRTGRPNKETGILDRIQYYISIRGTESFLLDIKNEIGLGGTIQYNTGTHQMRCGAKKDVEKFRDYIYSNSHIYLDRKYEKFFW